MCQISDGSRIYAVDKHCAVVSLSSTIKDQVEDYAIPVFSDAHSVEFPVCKMSDLQPVVYEFQQIFKTTPGKTDASYHYISTTGPPVRVPPKKDSNLLSGRNFGQLQSMLNQRIIKQMDGPSCVCTEKIWRNLVVC